MSWRTVVITKTSKLDYSCLLFTSPAARRKDPMELYCSLILGFGNLCTGSVSYTHLDSVKLECKVSSKIVVDKGNGAKITTEIDLPDKIDAPVEKNRKIGCLLYTS